MFSETVVVLVTGSGLARGAGTMLRRLVVRVALLIGFTAGAWLVGVLFAGTASADVRLPLDVPGVNLDIAGDSAQPPAATNSKTTKGTKAGDNGGLGGLVGGLVGTVTGTVTNTVSTVTTTVTKTVTTVTTTVTNTVGTVTKTVTNVVEDVTKLPEQILTPPPAGTDDEKPSLLPEPVTDLLDLGRNSGAGSSTQRTEPPPAMAAPAVASQAAATSVVEAAPDSPRVNTEPRKAQTTALPVRAGWTSEKAAPADNRPGPLPSPTAPVAPAAPCPTFSSGGNGGSDARGTLAVLPLQTHLVPPQVSRLHDRHFAAELGRTAGLPATPPD